MPSNTARIDEGGALTAGSLSDVLGLPASAPPPPTANPHSPGGGGGGPIVSSTPNPGQGIALDSAGKLPASIVALQVGFAFSYVELQSSVNVTATVEATANTIVTAAPITFDGATAICVEFGAYRVDKGTNVCTLVLFDAVGTSAAASIGSIALCGASQTPVVAKRYFTPGAGVHTLSVRAIVDAGTGVVWADVGGAGKGMPAYVRVTRA